MTCIYCKTTDETLFKGREHVIPRSFGAFGSKTPTLHCVCDRCNAYFKRDLDQDLARDTLEGVTRYKKGILSRQRQFPKNLLFTLDESAEYGDYGGALLGGYDPATGKTLPIVPQFWIRNLQTREWERYKIEQIKNIKIQSDTHGSSGGREMRILAPSREEYEEVLAELKKYNISYREKEMLDKPPFLRSADHKERVEVRGIIHGTIDKTRKRALVKILFNFATYFLGESEMLKPQWNKARQFIRYDGESLLGRISQDPFWNGQETLGMRFADDSYNLRIENRGGNTLGVIQLYNLFTYEFILVENYLISPEKEVACRFTPGEEPLVGFKMKSPNLPAGQ